LILNVLKTNPFILWAYYKYKNTKYRIAEPGLRHALEYRLENRDFLFENIDFDKLRERTLNYVGNMRVEEEPYGQFRYSDSVVKPLLYSSTYAALTRHLLCDLDGLSVEQRNQWVEYISSYQDDDGLFRDPFINNSIADSVAWWGWVHLTVHALMALCALGCTAPKIMKFLQPFRDPQYLIKLLDNAQWGNIYSDVGNQIMNYGVLLQYARDFHNEKWAGEAIEVMLDWLTEAQSPETGLWDHKAVLPPRLSFAVQTAYHIWILYFYEGRMPKYTEKIIDSCLVSQNALGGFGFYLNSSACEDIDSIDPLVRLRESTCYRSDDIEFAMLKALAWIQINGNQDGGYVFRRNQAFTYGHKFMYSKAEQSAMFPTWFRTLSLAYLGKAMPHSKVGQLPWQFINCPGYQFWRE
jgi:hypothetical protein